MKYVVYRITNKLTGQYYIGCHMITGNFLESNYWGSGTDITLAIKAFGKKVFEREIIEEFDNEKDALDREKTEVGELWKTDMLCYNKRSGGCSGNSKILKGRIVSMESRKKISEAKKGTTPTEEAIENMRKAQQKRNEWYILPEESRQKMSNSGKGKKWWNNPETGEQTKAIECPVGFSPGRLPFSEEAKKNMGASHKGLKHSAETRQKISKAHAGRVFSEEHCQKISEAKKKK